MHCSPAALLSIINLLSASSQTVTVAVSLLHAETTRSCTDMHSRCRHHRSAAQLCGASAACTQQLLTCPATALLTTQESLHSNSTLIPKRTKYSSGKVSLAQHINSCMEHEAHAAHNPSSSRVERPSITTQASQLVSGDVTLAHGRCRQHPNAANAASSHTARLGTTY